MSRGLFDVVGTLPAYADAKKDWHVELSNCTYVWFDTIIDPVPGFDIAAMMRDYLKGLREDVQHSLDKHFVYYLASRVRVRFCTRKKPRYSLLGGKLVFHIEIGRRRTLRRCVVTLHDLETRQAIRPKVDLSDRYITLHNGNGGKTTLSIYDFLSLCGIETGIDSEVHYVGYTRNPADRPLDRAHRGFGDMLHWTSRDDEAYDYFIFYNLFKVLSLSADPRARLNFVVSNAMTDEVKVADEGQILEKVLIRYFDTRPQRLNQAHEASELNHRLERLAERHQIQSITFDLSMQQPGELFRFYSRRVAPADRHHFTCRLGTAGAEIVAPKAHGVEAAP